MQTIAVEMAMEYIFAAMNLLPIIFQKKKLTHMCKDTKYSPIIETPI